MATPWMQHKLTMDPPLTRHEGTMDTPWVHHGASDPPWRHRGDAMDTRGDAMDTHGAMKSPRTKYGDAMDDP